MIRPTTYLPAMGFLLLCASAFGARPAHPSNRHHPTTATQGSLIIRDSQGELNQECPLKHTSVNAEISGFVSRVTVTQDFENTAHDKVEAVYVFPLPNDSAVDDMTMIVGDRVVKGLIKRGEEARAIYNAARDRGQLAGLLDQERPNIFTQSVANIAPGAKVRITISYVERLKYEAGTYEFSFPMVVGPRYSNQTVADAEQITPPVAFPHTRAGHDLSLKVSLDAGVPLNELSSSTHDVNIDRNGLNRAVVSLKDQQSIPNRDFILKYEVAGKKIEDAVLTHRSEKGSFFTLIVQPPARVNIDDVAPKELVFVLDTSGSMYGFPLEKAKEAMKYALNGLNPRDTFNLITFSGDTHILFPQPVPATSENLERAQRFLAERSGSGGTEMMKAIKAALDPTDHQDHVRVVCFMTDGYVGNDEDIIAEVRRHPKARVFAFGIGSAVNHYLLDKMAEQGRGEVDYVGLRDDGSAAAKRFHERVRNPLLTDITLDWGGLQVSEVYPQRIPDLFAAKPIMVTGKFLNPGKGTIRLKGNVGGQSHVRDLQVEFPKWQTDHDTLATLWARTKIDALSMSGNQDAPVEITKLGLEYKLMTKYTSFVAVEESTVTDGGQPRKVQVPVEMPEGVSYRGVFGESATLSADASNAPRSSFMNFGGQSLSVAVTSEPFAKSRAPREAPLPIVVDRPVRAQSVKLAADLTGESLTKLAHNGKVEVQVWLKDTSQTTLDALKKVGFEIIGQPQSSGVVLGRIGTDKVKALSELHVVTYVASAG